MSAGLPGLWARGWGVGEDATPTRLQPPRPEVFTAGVIYIVQVCIWETSWLWADRAIALDLQT